MLTTSADRIKKKAEIIPFNTFIIKKLPLVKMIKHKSIFIIIVDTKNKNLKCKAKKLLSEYVKNYQIELLKKKVPNILYL